MARWRKRLFALARDARREPDRLLPAARRADDRDPLLDRALTAPTRVALSGSLRSTLSVTCSPQLTGLPSSPASWIAVWTMKRSGAAPCQWFSRLEVDAVAGPDLLDRAALALAAADALGDEDRLPERVRVPGGAGRPA